MSSLITGRDHLNLTGISIVDESTIPQAARFFRKRASNKHQRLTPFEFSQRAETAADTMRSIRAKSIEQSRRVEERSPRAIRNMNLKAYFDIKQDFG